MFDWNAIMTSLVLTLAPVLVTALVTYVGVLVRSAWADFKSKQPQIVDEIEWAAPMITAAVEQMRKSNVIPGPEEAKKQAVSLMETYLQSKGFSTELIQPLADIISASIEAEVNKLPPLPVPQVPPTVG